MHIDTECTASSRTTTAKAIQIILPDQEWPGGEALASNEDSIQSVEEKSFYIKRENKKEKESTY